MLEIADLRDGSNVIVTERVIAPGQSLPTPLTIPNPQETSNVVVTERVILPTSGMIGNLSMPPELSSALGDLNQSFIFSFIQPGGSVVHRVSGITEPNNQ